MQHEAGTPSFQTLLAFRANPSYGWLRWWLNCWKEHHAQAHHWAPISLFANNQATFYRRRGLPYWNNRPQLETVAIVKCPNCGLWLRTAWDYTLHVPKEAFPAWVYEDFDDWENNSICWQLDWLLHEQWWEIPNRIPRFAIEGLATSAEIEAKLREPFYPVICAYCKVWVQDAGCALLHKTCPAVCYEARHKYWQRPELTDPSYMNKHALGITTLEPRLRPLVFWRHAFVQLMQHRYEQLFHARSLFQVPVLADHRHLFEAVLDFLSCPFQGPFSHEVLFDKVALSRKLRSHQTLLKYFPYLRHF